MPSRRPRQHADFASGSGRPKRPSWPFLRLTLSAKRSAIGRNVHSRILTLLLLLTLLLIAGCSDPLPQALPAAAPATSPERISIRDAVNFSVEYAQDAKLVHVRETTPGRGRRVRAGAARGA